MTMALCVCVRARVQQVIIDNAISRRSSGAADGARKLVEFWSHRDWLEGREQ